MSLTHTQAAILASKRLKMDGRSLLTLQSYIGNALNNLARQCANDDYKRRYLMTTPSTVIAPVTYSNYNYYAELSNLIATSTIYPVGTCESDDGGGVAALITQDYPTGLAVTVTNTSGNFVGIEENTIYYLIYISANTYKFALTYQNAIDGIQIVTSTGTIGTVTVTPLSYPQVMLDYLQYGTILYTYPVGSCQSDDGGGVVAQITQDYPTGLPVRVTNTIGNFTGLSEGVTYYLIAITANTYKFATTLARALAGTAIVTATGVAGTVTVTPWTSESSQWLASPTQASLISAIPYNYIYIWLEGTKLYTNAVEGTFQLNVPFVPTLESLPEILESDLIDSIVQIAVTQGFTPMTQAEQ